MILCYYNEAKYNNIKRGLLSETREFQYSAKVYIFIVLFFTFFDLLKLPSCNLFCFSLYYFRLILFIIIIVSEWIARCNQSTADTFYNIWYCFTSARTNNTGQHGMDGQKVGNWFSVFFRANFENYLHLSGSIGVSPEKFWVFHKNYANSGKIKFPGISECTRENLIRIFWI